MADATHKEHSSKGGKIGGKISPTNFKNNPDLAREAGRRSKRGPNKIRCDWCGDEIGKGNLPEHAQAEHPNLYRKFFEKDEPQAQGAAA